MSEIRGYPSVRGGAQGALRPWLALLAGLALLCPAAALGAFPGANGKIAFQNGPSLGADSEIFLINPDGTNPVQLTFDVGGVVGSDEGPAFSGNGRFITWESEHADDDAYLMRADGTGQHPVPVAFSEFMNNPVLSIDGRFVAFSGEGATDDIYIVRTDGTGLRNLTQNPGAQVSFNPDLAPDGSIYFESKHSVNPDREIWRINRNGGGKVQITHLSPAMGPSDPDVSPDGKRLAVQINRDIYTLRTNGTVLDQITFTGTAAEPAFSPDGRWIAYADEVDGDYEIYRVRSTGGAPQRVTENTTDDHAPDWQPRNRCGGRLVTQVGTTRRDIIRGTRRADSILAHAGNDVVKGLRGNDRLCGAAGRDRLFGGPGRDRLFGGRGFDRLFGGPGFDRLRGGPGRDRQRQ